MTRRICFRIGAAGGAAGMGGISSKAIIRGVTPRLRLCQASQDKKIRNVRVGRI
ncbi:hypothetical protein [Gluconobacter sphaericus]|uniref:hypothetical protein n=1 Tax=Gluconobacter sphaericus TaxID=574987 RepID=UPI0020126B0E|nr:hypothetical protein [Gluconobacter sphaericus]